MNDYYPVNTYVASIDEPEVEIVSRSSFTFPEKSVKLKQRGGVALRL